MTSIPTSPQRYRRWLKSGLVLLGLLLFNAYLEYRGAFEPFALAMYDWFQRPSTPHTPRELPLVTVFQVGGTEEARSEADRIGEARILRMIQVISCAHPAVIGVDWRSGSWRPAGVDMLKSPPASLTRIVWARELNETGEVGKVAGGVRLADNWTAGIAAVKPDRDRAVRRYIRWFKEGGDAFSWSVTKAFCDLPDAKAPGCALVARCSQQHDCEQQPLLNYRDGSEAVNQFPADALPGLSDRVFVGCSALPQSGENPFIKNQIVLIGDAERTDLHDTPYGAKLGVSIMAHAIEADLLGSGIKEEHGIPVYVLHFLSVVIVILMNRIPRPLLVLWFNAIGLPLLAVIFSYAAFRTFYHWFDFAPILGGVIIHQLYEQAQENRKLRAEMAELLGRSVAPAPPS